MNPPQEQVQHAPASREPGRHNGEGGLDTPAAETAPVPRGALGLFDAVNIIVGIVVGAGIYQTAPFIFKHVGDIVR